MRSTYTGPATVFRHDKNGRTFYSVAECRKNSEGETLFGYKLVQFKKGVELADKTKIDIQNAWESFYLNQDGEAVFYVFIADFTLQQPQQPGAYQQPPAQYGQPGAYQQPSQTWAPGSISVGGIAQPPAQYPQNTVQQQFGMPPQYQQPAQQTWSPQSQQPQQPAQPDPADTFEQIDEEEPF